MRSISARRWALLLLVMGGVILLDQISKAWVLATIPYASSLPLIPPILYLTYSTNTGAAFGLLPQAGDLFMLIAVVVVIGLMIYYPRTPDRAVLVRVALALICGGALGNVIDRVQHGHVVDFVHIVLPGVVSNVSNFADHAIVLGVVLIFIDNLLETRESKQPSAAPLNSTEQQPESSA
jgi:signal peptidase II